MRELRRTESPTFVFFIPHCSAHCTRVYPAGPARTVSQPTDFTRAGRRGLKNLFSWPRKVLKIKNILELKKS